MNVQQLLESANPYARVMDTANTLVSKWTKSGLLEGLKGEVEKNNMAILLENQAKQLVVESNQTGIGGGAATFTAGFGENWAGVALPLVRRVFGDISAKEFVSVQSMSLPSGLIFYLDFKYGTDKKRFDGSLYGATTDLKSTDTTKGLYGVGKFGYSINQFSASLTAATASISSLADVNYDSSVATGSLKKITVTNGAAQADQDLEAVRACFISGSNFDESTILPEYTKVSGNNLIFIATGSPAHGTVTLFFNKANRDNARGDFEDRADYSVPNANSSSQISIPSLDVNMKSEAVVAKTRKLKAQWTPEFAQDLNAYHSIDAEAELTSLMSQYISMEIDLELLEMLIKNVPTSTTEYWSAQNNVAWNGTSFASLTNTFYNTQGGWFQTLGTKLQKVSNKIHQLTMRGGANFLVVSPTVATILESIPGFASDGDGDKAEFNFGIQKIGSLNSRYKVYKNPYFTENLILMGYKGAQFLETGAVFAPYIPVMMTPLVYDPTTFTPRKGLMTRYAKKMVRPEFYGKVIVHGLETV
jgi:hypothetical protein